MAEVIVTIVFQGQAHAKKREIDEKVLSQRSRTLRKTLADMPASQDDSPKHVSVYGSYGPMGMLLDDLKQHGQSNKYKVRFSALPVEHVAMLWEATELLDIVPKQIHLRIYIRGVIAKQKLRPQQIITLHRIFYATRDEEVPKERLSIWKVLIHQTAFMIDNADYTTAEIDAIQAAVTTPHPELADAIHDKILDLQRRRNNFESAKEASDRRTAAKKINRRVAEYKAEQRERKEEELRGERELSEGMAKVVLTRPHPFLTATVQEGKHGQRRRHGEGRGGRKSRDAAEEADVGEN